MILSTCCSCRNHKCQQKLFQRFDKSEIIYDTKGGWSSDLCKTKTGDRNRKECQNENENYWNKYRKIWKCTCEHHDPNTASSHAGMQHRAACPEEKNVNCENTMTPINMYTNRELMKLQKTWTIHRARIRVEYTIRKADIRAIIRYLMKIVKNDLQIRETRKITHR